MKRRMQAYLHICLPRVINFLHFSLDCLTSCLLIDKPTVETVVEPDKTRKIYLTIRSRTLDYKPRTGPHN